MQILGGLGQQRQNDLRHAKDDDALTAGLALVPGAVRRAGGHDEDVSGLKMPLGLVDCVGAGAAAQVKQLAVGVDMLIRHAEYRAVQRALYIDIGGLLFKLLGGSGVGIVLHRGTGLHG